MSMVEDDDLIKTLRQRPFVAVPDPHDHVQALRRSVGLLLPCEVATMFSVTEERIDIWRKEGYGPKRVLIGRQKFYRMVDVLAFINSLEARHAE